MKTWPKKADEVLCVIVDGWSGVVSWSTGQRVFGKQQADGTWTIRPENKLGPTTICVPDGRLKIIRKPRKPLNKKEAAQIVADHIGPRGGVRIEHHRMGMSFQIIELKHVGDLIIHGQHPSSWREAFKAAGIFNI